ncbi:MAG: cell division protein ZapD [Gammaproteobacteria bacterium]
MSDKITYEHPLNERVRLLLRLAHLLDQFSVYYPRADSWDSRCAISVLVDISSLLGRSDIKAEVIKETERQLSRLMQIRSTPGIDARRLGKITDSLENAMSNLRISSPGPLGSELRDNEFLKAVTQRSAIPGGTCTFDMPQYHYWLMQPEEKRIEELATWFDTLLPLKQAVSLLVELIRTSSMPEQRVAQQGFYQQSLDTKAPVQLLRVTLPYIEGMIAEISGGKHRFSVRFMDVSEGITVRPSQVLQDVAFDLTICVM